MKTLNLTLGMMIVGMTLGAAQAKDLSQGGVSMTTATKILDSMLSRKTVLGSTNASAEVKNLEKQAARHSTVLNLQGVEEALQVNSESVMLKFRF